MSIYTPYFYVIQDTRNGMYYAGSKYSKNPRTISDPNLFMVEGGYTTSSNKINEIIERHGLDTFIIHKLRLFETAKEAVDYETRFLKRIDARRHPEFYNGHNNDGIRPFTEEERKEISNARYGVDHPMQNPEIKQKSLENSRKMTFEKYGVYHNFSIPEVREQIIKTNNERYGVDYYSQTEDWKIETKKTNNATWGVDWTSQSKDVKMKVVATNNERYGVDYYSQTDEAKVILRQRANEQYLDPIKKEKHRIASSEHNAQINVIWITMNFENKRIAPEEYDKYAAQGWTKGRFIDSAFGKHDKNGINNPFFGKRHSESTKKELSKKKKDEYENPEYKEAHKKRCLDKRKEKYNSESGVIMWINNEKEEKMIAIENYDPMSGWVKGRIKRKKL